MDPWNDGMTAMTLSTNSLPLDAAIAAATCDEPDLGSQSTDKELSALCDRIRNRYVSSDWDNEFITRLELVLCRTGDGQLLPIPKIFHGETGGIAVTGPSRDGKTTLVRRVMGRVFGERLDDNRPGKHVIYHRIRTAATLKSVYSDLCKATGFTSFPARMTVPEAHDLAIHRLRLAGIRIVILDEVHNLLGYDNRAVNLFLKTFLQDGGGFCLIVIGTPVLRKFIYDVEDNEELAGRLFDFPLERFPEATSFALIRSALEGLCSDAGLRLAQSIHRDPYFTHRILEGCRGSYGRAMRLISTSIVLALEEGGSAVDVEDFRRVFDLQLLHFNPENPFRLSDWANRSTAPFGQPGQVSDNDFGAVVTMPKRRTGRKRSKK